MCAGFIGILAGWALGCRVFEEFEGEGNAAALKRFVRNTISRHTKHFA